MGCTIVQLNAANTSSFSEYSLYQLEVNFTSEQQLFFAMLVEPRNNIFKNAENILIWFTFKKTVISVIIEV